MIISVIIPSCLYIFFIIIMYLDLKKSSIWRNREKNKGRWTIGERRFVILICMIPFIGFIFGPILIFCYIGNFLRDCTKDKRDAKW